ncbi:jg25554, partial [Pararge aegeria aegeria]
TINYYYCDDWWRTEWNVSCLCDVAAPNTPELTSDRDVAKSPLPRDKIYRRERRRRLDLGLGPTSAGSLFT